MEGARLTPLFEGSEKRPTAQLCPRGRQPMRDQQPLGRGSQLHQRTFQTQEQKEEKLIIKKKREDFQVPEETQNVK